MTGQSERRWWRWKTNVGPVLAILAGIVLTVWGVGLDIHLAKTEWSPWETLKEWLPHFGPELIILAFATMFIERAVRKAEERRSLRFRAVQAIMGLVSYALDRHVYFDGGASNYLEMEWDALEIRQKGRRSVLWSNELASFDAAHKAGFSFMKLGIQFAKSVYDLNSRRSALRVDLLGHPAFSDWAVVAALEENTKAAFRHVPIKHLRPDPLKMDDLLDGGKLQDWKAEMEALKSTWPAIASRLDSYFMNDEEIIKLRVELLNEFFAFQNAAIAFRDCVWKSDDPDK
jgi:hypothetical protein